MELSSLPTEPKAAAEVCIHIAVAWQSACRPQSSNANFEHCVHNCCTESASVRSSDCTCRSKLFADPMRCLSAAAAGDSVCWLASWLSLPLVLTSDCSACSCCSVLSCVEEVLSAMLLSSDTARECCLVCAAMGSKGRCSWRTKETLGKRPL